MIVVGLMSGTSADGIDAAVVRLEGKPPEIQWQVLGWSSLPHTDDLRREIFACFRPETGTVERLCRLNFELGKAFGHAALESIRAIGLTPSQVDLIGCHGQTVWHEPPGVKDAGNGSTLQIGEPAVIAEMTGLPVVSNFRTRDMAVGGQGAPLVAYVDALLFSHPLEIRAVQNIGGIANVTYLPAKSVSDYQRVAISQDLYAGAFAFDTGPGNMLLDYAAGRASQGKMIYDQDGALSSRGQVDVDLLNRLLEDAYLHQSPPKTTGRERYGVQFGEQVWDEGVQRGLLPQDIVATLAAFTAQSIARAYRSFLPRYPSEVIVSGGGTHNPTLMAMLRDVLSPARVYTSDEFGLGVDVKEAVAFAVLAYESWHHRPANLPAATGARRAVVLGNITSSAPIGAQKGEFVDVDKFRGSVTEARNPRTLQIDTLPTLEMVQLINQEDHRVAQGVAEELPRIARAVDGIAERMQRGGRLIYMGAGTSGRMGLLDASECPPTFNTSPDLVVGLVAGGQQAFVQAVEGAEDRSGDGLRDIIDLQVGPLDSVMGIAASGSTPYVLGGMQEARRRGAFVISLTCNRPSLMEAEADLPIVVLVGPEVVSGSTRLKAGTAQKMVLNMISTGVMVRLGKTFSNLMVDLQPTNQKLRERARKIVAQACELSVEQAGDILQACDGEVKTAIVAVLADLSPQEARQRLLQVGGVVRAALSRA